tara:strand:+ start:247 stop:1113 length:867 start_codon:yes stop_codon:yes gene_type:complete
MYEIDIPDVIIPRTTTIGGSAVLPGLPYEPQMPNFPSVDISTSTLPAHNAAQQIGHSLNSGPRPSPTVVHDTMAGAGAKPMPNGNFTVMAETMPTVNLGNAREQRPPVHSPDKDLGRYDMRGQGLDPNEAIGVRPTHTMEMYGAPSSVDVTDLDIARAEVRLNSLPTVHSVDAAYGGNPYEAKKHDFIRPMPAQVNVPRVRVPKTVRKEPIIQMPIIPAPPRIKMPRIPRVDASPVQVEAKRVLPPVTGDDLGIGQHGKLLATTKKSMGPIGISAGRSFGAEGSMSPF